MNSLDEKWQNRWRALEGHTNVATHIALSHGENHWIAAAYGDGKIVVWEKTSGRCCSTITEMGDVESYEYPRKMVFSHNNKWIAGVV